LFAGSHLAVLFWLFDFTPHLVKPKQRSIHDFFASANCGGRDATVRAITTFGDRFNRRKILMVAVAISKEEKLFYPRSLLQPD